MDKDILIFMDYVVVLGTRIDRPARVGRSDWMAEWEAVQEGIHARRIRATPLASRFPRIGPMRQEY